MHKAQSYLVLHFIEIFKQSACMMLFYYILNVKYNNVYRCIEIIFR